MLLLPLLLLIVMQYLLCAPHAFTAITIDCNAVFVSAPHAFTAPCNKPWPILCHCSMPSLSFFTAALLRPFLASTAALLLSAHLLRRKDLILLIYRMALQR